MIKNKYKISFNNYFGLNPKRCRNFFLIQAGEALCSKDTVIPSHEQGYFEITYACHGKGISYVNEQPYALKKNDCFFSFPGEIHRIESDEEDPLRFIFLAFYAKEGTNSDALIRNLTERCCQLSERKFNLEKLSPLLLDLLKELRSEDIYSTRVISFLLEHILIECCRRISINTVTPPLSLIADDKLLSHDIITYIDTHIFTLKRIQDLENEFYYNIQALSRCFHEQTGISIHQYYISKKMETAAQLLAEGKTVTQVGEMLGYSSIHSFSRAYKKHFNLSPSSEKKINSSVSV